MSIVTPYDYDFRIAGTAARVYSGKDALGNLPAELIRNRARRAFIICGRSVSRKNGLIDRLRAPLGDSLVGLYDEMRKDTPLADVIAARDAARAADSLQRQLASIGMPRRVGDLDIPRASAAIILENSLKNFNADPKREFIKECELLGEILDAAW